MVTRRILIKILGLTFFSNLLHKIPVFASEPMGKVTAVDPVETVFRSINGTPAENMKKIVTLLGGIESLFQKTDVVVIKPNVQWWNQGAPNLEALYTFVQLIMNRPGGFDGEVVIAENCHRGAAPWNSAGWSNTFDRNGSLSGISNYNELTVRLKEEFKERYSTVHLINVESGADRVSSPVDGTGYVYCDGTRGTPRLVLSNGAKGESFRETIMTYPIFKTDRGTIIDYKNGIWENGTYDNDKLKLINFAALNHHSGYCGFTSVIKNYLGVSDLSGGPDPHAGGKLTDKYYNFHSFPFNKWAAGPLPGMIGAEIGVFLSTIRRAALNIVTAEYIGLADRIQPPVAHTRAVLASRDPVALDYHSAKYILYPNSRIQLHHPDNPKSPAHQYTKACSDYGGGVFDERRVQLVSYDIKNAHLQTDSEATIIGQKEWLGHPKGFWKYMLMRYGSFLL